MTTMGLMAKRREPTERTEKQVYAVGIRIPADVYVPLARISEQEDRSLNQQIVRCLRECVSRYEATSPLDAR